MNISGRAGHGVARRGEAGHGKARRGKARQGGQWPDKFLFERPGQARRGEAGLGLARLGVSKGANGPDFFEAERWL